MNLLLRGGIYMFPDTERRFLIVILRYLRTFKESKLGYC